MVSDNHPDHPLHRLNDDVLRMVCELLRPRGNLRPLSITCKWIRTACIPVLFRECIVQSKVVDRQYGRGFIPRSLWPYVCTLWFSGHFTRHEIEWLNIVHYHGLEDHDRAKEELHAMLVLVKQISNALRVTLGSMHALKSIRIFMTNQAVRAYHGSIYGISPYILEAIMSTPHLQRLSITGPLFHFRDSWPSDVAIPPLADLSIFTYCRNDIRSAAHVSHAEREEILHILARTHDRLEELDLPAECAPLDWMATWDWPSLRTLWLRGERAPSSLPLTYMLSKMPRLREASLLLAEPVNGGNSPMSRPSSSDSQVVCRDLEILNVAHPNPEDDLYSRLSRDLLCLALRCWPRYYKLHTRFEEEFSAAGVQWTSPLLSSSEMLRILRRVDAPQLYVMDLEFRADPGDTQLFRHIGSAFPALKFLCVHRYRMASETELPLIAIARALSSLQHLEVLMLHLDFLDLPDVGEPVVNDDHVYEVPPARAQQLADSDATLARAANVMAGLLGPSLQWLPLLRPTRDHEYQWVLFRIVRSTDAEDGDKVTAEHRWPWERKPGEPAFPYHSLLRDDD